MTDFWGWGYVESGRKLWIIVGETWENPEKLWKTWKIFFFFRFDCNEKIKYRGKFWQGSNITDIVEECRELSSRKSRKIYQNWETFSRLQLNYRCGFDLRIYFKKSFKITWKSIEALGKWFPRPERGDDWLGKILENSGKINDIIF